jgi:hypothetical protein
MSNNAGLPGGLSAVTVIEVAVPREEALLAAHVLRRPPPEPEPPDRPRGRRLDQRAVAIVVIIGLLLLAGLLVLFQQPVAR